MLPAALLEGFVDTITLEPWTGQDDYGKPTYGAAVTHPARVEVRSRRLAGSAGVDILARGRIFLATTTVPSNKDRLTLPLWAAPTQPPILDVQPHLGNGMDHIAIYFG